MTSRKDWYVPFPQTPYNNTDRSLNGILNGDYHVVLFTLITPRGISSLKHGVSLVLLTFRSTLSLVLESKSSYNFG